MKLVINTEYGKTHEETIHKRQDSAFIELVETGRFVGHVDEKFGFAELLRVVEIPDDVSDYKILNYDGSEIVVYCHNGKLHFVPQDTDASSILRY